MMLVKVKPDEPLIIEHGGEKISISINGTKSRLCVRIDGPRTFKVDRNKKPKENILNMLGETVGQVGNGNQQ